VLRFSRGDCAGDCDRDSDSDCAAGSEQVQRWCRASGAHDVQMKRCRCMGMQMQSRRIGAEVKRWCRGAGVQSGAEW